MKLIFNLTTTILMSILLGVLFQDLMEFNSILIAVLIIPVVLILRVFTIIKY